MTDFAKTMTEFDENFNAGDGTSSSSNKATTLPQDDDSDEVPIEVESLCMNCFKNGITKLKGLNIPFYKQVIISSFYCDECGFENNSIQSGQPLQEFGTEIVLKVSSVNDLNRTVIRSEYAYIEIPELYLQAPPKSTSGDLTTVEGVLANVKNDLQLKQAERREAGMEELANKIDTFIEKVDELASLKRPWTLKIHDPSGNCFIQNPNPFNVDPHCIITHYYRSPDENSILGINEGESTEQNSTKTDNEWKSYEDVKNEVLTFKGCCSACDIPYFRTVIVMSTDCDRCGFKSNEIQSGSAIQPEGCRITLQLKEVVDLSRDVLKTDTCTLIIPELDFECGAGILSGRFTTVEGLLVATKEKLEEQSPFFVGDSAPSSERETYERLIKKLDSIILLKTPATLILDDPAGNSYLMSLTAPLNDIRLKKEFYIRTFEQNDELGLNDMKIENYSNSGTIYPIEEEADVIPTHPIPTPPIERRD